jgi:hypothetical protein
MPLVPAGVLPRLRKRKENGMRFFVRYAASNIEGKQTLCSQQHDQGTTEEHERRLTERRVRDASRRATETEEERERQLRDKRDGWASGRDTEMPEERERRITDRRHIDASRRATETPEKRERQLKDKRDREASRRATETEEEKEKRNELRRQRYVASKLKKEMNCFVVSNTRHRTVKKGMNFVVRKPRRQPSKKGMNCFFVSNIRRRILGMNFVGSNMRRRILGIGNGRCHSVDLRRIYRKQFHTCILIIIGYS